MDKANGLAVTQVQRLVAEHAQGRTAGFMDQRRVNVLELNVALKELAHR